MLCAFKLNIRPGRRLLLCHTVRFANLFVEAIVADLTYNDTLGAYQPYAKAVRPYLLRADTHPYIRKILSKSQVRILVDLVSRARIRNPDKEIKVKLERVASDLSVDRRTVTRAISTFFSLGWLLPNPGYDGRNRRGRFAAQQYVISQTLRGLIGMPVKAANTVAGDVENENQGNAVSAETPDSAEAEMSHGLVGVNKSLLKKEASFNKEAEKPAGLPPDLRPMQRELGIEHKGMCALMRLAKELGQRLQDVWHVKKHLLIGSGIKGGRAVNYVKALLRSGDDFAYVARTRFAAPGATNGTPRQASARQSPRKRPSGLSNDRAELEQIALSSRFKRYKHIAKDMVFCVYDGTADVIHGAVRTFYDESKMEGIYRGIAAGNLVEAFD